MLNITDDAMQICSTTVRQLGGGQANTKCLRLIKSAERLSVSLEVPETTDRIVQHRGQAVLAIPEQTAADLSGKTLDVLDDGCLVIS